MSTLKMTFSLASLILILGLVFATAPAMAQIDQMLYFGAADNTNAPTAGDGIAIIAAPTIPASGHLIITKGDPSTRTDVGLPADGVLATGQVIQWSAMPNLEEIFFGNGGGTILLKGTKTALAGTPAAVVPTGGTNFRVVDHDADDVGPTGPGAHTSAVANDNIKDTADLTATPTPTATSHPATADIDIAEAHLSITEIMWALDNSVAGSGNEPNRQWIEIYNRTQAPIVLTGLILHIKSGRPALSTDDTKEVLNADSTAVTTQGRNVLDRITNVSGGGWTSAPPGQNGFTSNDVDTRVDFISMYRKRDKLGKDEGSNRGHWLQSSNVYLAGYKGTPGKAERTGPKVFTKTDLPLSPIIFNEIANRSDTDKAYEWIELRNVSDAEANLKNWQISITTTMKEDKEFFNFYDKDIKVAAGGILLLVASDPTGNPDHPLAGGWNVEKGANDQANGINANSPRYLVMKAAEKDEDGQRGLRMADGLPDGGKFVLILRTGNDKEGKAEKLVDIVGYDDDLNVNEAGLFTGLWPLVNYTAPVSDKNALNKDTVHRRQHASVDGTGTTHNDKKDDQVAMRDIGWTSIGYKRNAEAKPAHGGTPGYPNDAEKSEFGADMAMAPVLISEVMYDHNRNLPQWIEIRNVSPNIGVNVDNWIVYIVNHNNTADGGEYAGKLSDKVELDGRIPPGQTLLVVARKTNVHNSNLPNDRIISASKRRSETLLNPYGFQITLKAKTNESDTNKHQTVDMVGNLGDAPANTRRADAQSFEDLAWMLPAGVDEDGNRVSILRLSGKTNGVAAKGNALDGMEKWGWQRFDMSEKHEPTTYYGRRDDIGSPGHTQGGVLPVSLSKFRPERMKDTGEIVVRWVTESELNNAGFNILRSEKRDSDFTKVYFVAGQGTTSERTAYEWKDKTAKPNVVYYYQIQDISLDGQVTTLRTTHLRGNVTAAGKLTTTWGELKALQ